MDHTKEKELAAGAWDATKRDDQPGYEALSAAYKPTLFAKVKSVEQHGPAEDDAFEQEVARLLGVATPAQLNESVHEIALALGVGDPPTDVVPPTAELTPQDAIIPLPVVQAPVDALPAEDVEPAKEVIKRSKR